MKRVFQFDVLECPDCQGRLRIIVVGRDPGVIRRILEHLGIDPRPPPLQGPASYPEPEAPRT